jgi:hypothetical protein
VADQRGIATFTLLNSFNPRPGVPILDFWQCRLLNLTTYFRKKFEQLFFKYFPIHTLVFEKTGVDDVVCSSLGFNE